MLFDATNICPICGQRAEYNSYVENGIECEYTVVCKNRCCIEEFAYGDYRYTIFDKEFCYSYTISKKESAKLKDEIKKKIAYWKYKDRYLMELLTR